MAAMRRCCSICSTRSTLPGFEVREVPQTEALRAQRDQSRRRRRPVDRVAGDRVLMDPIRQSRTGRSATATTAPSRSRSNLPTAARTSRSDRSNSLAIRSGAQIEPRYATTPMTICSTLPGRDGLRQYAEGVASARLTFPPLKECRTEWEKRYPQWKWRNRSWGMAAGRP